MLVYVPHCEKAKSCVDYGGFASETLHENPTPDAQCMIYLPTFTTKTTQM